MGKFVLKHGKVLGLCAAFSIAAVPSFAGTGPAITVDYGAFGDNVIDQVQAMLAEALPVAAVLFGTIKGISWLRAIL